MKTTRNDFEKFKAEFLRWQRLLGLTDWRICFEHSSTTDAYAEIFANSEGRIATVVFGSTCEGDAKIGYCPVNTGRHEALELLLARLKSLALARNVTRADVEEEVHAVIRRLENLFNKRDDGK